MMNTWEAKLESVRRWGSLGTARTIRYVTADKHYANDYRVGILSNGLYTDMGRGSCYEKAFEQADAKSEQRKVRRMTRAGRIKLPSEARRLLEQLLEERRKPVIRAHDYEGV